jgi:hypothetical protein
MPKETDDELSAAIAAHTQATITHAASTLARYCSSQPRS